jgi:hypothetical protein
MPFKSKKQLQYLKINNPRLYTKWKDKYGTNVTKKKTTGKRRKV